MYRGYEAEKHWMRYIGWKTNKPTCLWYTHFFLSPIGGFFSLYLLLSFSRPLFLCVNDIRHKRERVWCVLCTSENWCFIFFSLMATNQPPSLKFGNVYGFCVCRPRNELCFHFIFHRLYICVYLRAYAGMRVCAFYSIPHKIYNNGLKRFRKQHHTRQSKLWNELTICFGFFSCVFLCYHVWTKWEATDESDGIKQNTNRHTHGGTHQMNTMFAIQSPCYTFRYCFFLSINEFLFIDFA